VAFQLGMTTLQVDDEPSALFHLEMDSQEKVLETSSHPLEGGLKTRLIEQLKSSLGILKDESKLLNFLEKPIQLQFEKGVQQSAVWNISYLPRKIGSMDADLPLIDPSAPKVSFELFLEKGKVMFSTDHKYIVLLNYQHIKKAPLKNGDLIVVGASYIRISIN